MRVTKHDLVRFGLQMAAVFFGFSIQAVAQPGGPHAVAKIDLKPLGVKAQPHGWPSEIAIELLFISDRFLALLAESQDRKDSHLILYEVGDRAVRPIKSVTLDKTVARISPARLDPINVLEWVDSEHFAYWSHLGRWICNTDLNCREGEPGEPLTAIPQTAGCNSHDLLGFIDAEKAVCLTYRKASAMVIDLSGHRLYELKQRNVPWDATLITSVHGRRFGLEWTSNTFWQLLEPLACLDECPTPGRSQFVIFNSSDGRKIRQFEWDPRPYNLYAAPALSPSGKTTAFVRRDSLEIYSLDAEH
jgi:hypothetical protein